MNCPCCSNEKLENCCEPFIAGKKSPETPEQLMRSRFTAFALKKMNYIFETTDPQTRTKFDMKANEEWAQSSQFQKLEILNTSFENNKGQVEFRATFQTGEQPPQTHHELSKFRKQAGVWYFREGKVKAETPK